MKIAVTGADGFIGSHLAEALVAEGHSIRVLSLYNSWNSWGWLDTVNPAILSKMDVVTGDIRDAGFMNAFLDGIDVVYHLAALIAIPHSYRAPESYVDTNIKGTLNTLEAAKRAGVKKFIQTSTSEVYGSAQYVPIDEAHPLQPQSPYSASKIASDQLALSYYYAYDFPVTVIRPFNTYGPRQSARAVIPSVITQLLKNKQLKIGALTPTRDFNFIQDTVMGFKACLETDFSTLQGEVINLGSGFEVSIEETIRLIAEILNVSVDLCSDEQRFRPKKSEVERLYCNNQKALQLLPWRPQFSGIQGFKRGLEKTIQWFEQSEQLKLYKTELYNC